VVSVGERVRALLGTHPELAGEARPVLVLALLLRDQYDAAGNVLAQAVKQAPEDDTVLLDYAAFLAHMEKWEAAQQLIAQALARHDTARAHCILAYVHGQQGQYEPAIAEYRKARELDKQYQQEGQAGEAVCLLRKGGSPSLAVRVAQTALEAGKPSPELHLLLGVAHALAGSLDFARMHVNDAATLAPQEPRYKEALALLAQ
jgi:Flp pilus assembly protein TadD